MTVVATRITRIADDPRGITTLEQLRAFAAQRSAAGLVSAETLQVDICGTHRSSAADLSLP